MIIDVDDYLAHYGTPRHSGRYPWGSGGDDTGQRNRDFLNYTAGLKREGMGEADIARGLGLSVGQLRAAKSIAKNAEKQADIALAQRLKDKGMSNVAIGERMGKNESSVRALLAPGEKDKADVLGATATVLKDRVGESKYIDIGTGAEYGLAVSRNKLNTAIALLEKEGYTIHYVKVEQLGTGQQTTIKVLAAPDTKYSEVFQNREKISPTQAYSQDGGRTYEKIHPPMSLSSKRVAIRYAEDGGTDADGVLYVRPGVKDVSLGEAKYAQVRVKVDDGHYLKGMAMYRDDLPPGVDVVFNTNKSSTGNKKDAMKKISDDPENPFGAVTRQIPGKDGKPTSAMNIVNEQGDWGKWSKSLSTQMLSKQSPVLAKTQLDMTFDRRKSQIDELSALTNPAVKRKLLEAAADDIDSAAVHLKAAALPRQASHVILPVNSMKETEVYAPNYRNGERVVLIRYPHGGIFEIPELTVNNRHPEAKSLLGNAPDAIGIHSKVAERLSGADFDGDTVLVIPNNQGKIKTAKALAGLKDFDPKRSYPAYDGMHTMDGGTWNAKTKKVDFPEGKSPSSRTKQVEMGKVSNLITDMTIQGANSSELARAVRHSMVVIDAEKHSLNYKQSAIDNNIPQLKEKYQGSKRGGAATLISNAGRSSTVRIPDRAPRRAKEGGPVDKATGKKVYTDKNESYVDKNGKIVVKTTEVPRLSTVDSAHKLSSGTPIERIYADHSDRLKALANTARKEAVNTKGAAYSPSAKAQYHNEARSLDAKLSLALRNAPLERQAQVLANAQYHARLRAQPDMDAADKKKIKAQSLASARNRTGAKKNRIDITDGEWEAIQAGAITNHKLTEILKHADLEQVKKLATPKTQLLMTSSKKQRAASMLASGYTQAEVADALGVSLTTLKNSLA